MINKIHDQFRWVIYIGPILVAGMATVLLWMIYRLCVEPISWRNTVDGILLTILYAAYTHIFKPVKSVISAIKTSEKEIESVKKSNDMMPEILDNL